MNKKTVILMFIITAVLFSCTCVRAEKPGTIISAGEEWSWEPGANNIIEGELNLTEYIGQDLTVKILSDLPYANDEEKAGSPVFMNVNGKRITMMKQTDTVEYMPTENEPFMTFSARFTMPGEKRVYGIKFQFSLNDTEGKEIRKFNAEINAGENGTEGPFYIPADIHMITAVICIAAAAVWVSALIMNRCYKKKQKKN